MNDLIKEFFPDTDTMTVMDFICTDNPDLHDLLTTQGYEVYLSDNGLMVKDSTGDVDMTLDLFRAIYQANKTT